LGRHVGLPVHTGEVVSTSWHHLAVSETLPRSLCVDAQPIAALHLEATFMLKKFTAHEVEVLRRDAKVRARTNDVIFSKALDQVAAEQGYRNWSLLQKKGCTPSDAPQSWLFRRTSEDISQSMRVVPEPASRFDRRARSDIARDSVQALDGKFANAVDFGLAYVEGLLAQPRFRLSTKSVAYWEMRLWLPYGANRIEGDTFILVNRHYKPVGSTTKDHVDYRTYPHLSLRLHGDSWRAFSHRTAEQPFLFNDGCPPWATRQDAEAYLGRLAEMRRLI
jgi:hypothetical protein